MNLRIRIAVWLRRISDRLDPHEITSAEALRRFPIMVEGVRAAVDIATDIAGQLKTKSEAA